MAVKLVFSRGISICKLYTQSCGCMVPDYMSYQPYCVTMAVKLVFSRGISIKLRRPKELSSVTTKIIFGLNLSIKYIFAHRYDEQLNVFKQELQHS